MDQQQQQQQQPIRMVYANSQQQQQPQQLQQPIQQLPPLPIQQSRNNMMMNGNQMVGVVGIPQMQQQSIPMVNSHLQMASSAQQTRVSSPMIMDNHSILKSNNNNNTNNNNTANSVVMMGNTQPLIVDQVPILYQTSPSPQPQQQQQQQSMVNQKNYIYPNNQQAQQQTNLYNNNLQSLSNNLMYSSNMNINNNTAGIQTMPSTVPPRFNPSPNGQPQAVPFSTPLNQSINNNLMPQHVDVQQTSYDQNQMARPPSVSTASTNNSNNNNTTTTTMGKVSPPSPSPITKFANKFMEIITPNERATYVNLSTENQTVSTSNISTTVQKPKAALKGLSNPMGEYNCFLNVVIQSLWNLEMFREIFLSIDPKNHKHKSFESCVYCSLQNLFTHFKYSENSILDPNLVRNSLSFAHNKDSKFQLKHMDDASEVFQAIIEDINNSLEYSQIPIFDFHVTDFYVCSKCNKFSDPHTYNTNNWCISSCEFVQKKRENPNITFEGALRSTIESFHKTCESCKERSDSQKHIFQAFPGVCSFSFSWNRDVISEDDILEFMSYFKIKQIKLHEIFRLNCNGSNIEVMGHVSSIICYYGRHYICLVYNKKVGSWFAIDDSNVRQIDADRLDDFIVSSKFQPCVVLVEIDSHQGNIRIENNMKEKATPNEIELLSPTKKRMSTSDIFSKSEESSSNTESQFIVVDQHFGVVIEGFNAVTDFFYWKHKISTHAYIYTRTVTLTRDQVQNLNSQLNICIYLGESLELSDNETVTVRLSCTQNQKNKSQPVAIGKLDNKKKSTFASIPIGFLITEASKNYEFNFLIKKEKNV